MNKVLFASHLANFVKFNKPFMQWFQEQGWEVHYASLDEEEVPFCSKHFKVDFNRSPYSGDNVRAYFQLKKIIDTEQYDIIHCHTPMGGVVTRLAARGARKQGTKVIYTAHGFHFYRGAPLINNLIYKNIECFLAKYTDALITINKEDYTAACKFRLAKGGQAYIISGVGVDIDAIQNATVNIPQKRLEFGINADALVVLSIGEMIHRKNHETELKAFAEAKLDNAFFLICGRGELEEKMKALADDLGIAKKVVFAGYRTDICEIVHIADMFLFATFQEGLGLVAIEAMAAGLPLVTSDIRGVNEFSCDGVTGYTAAPNDVVAFTRALRVLASDKELRQKFAQYNMHNVERFSVQNAVEAMAVIYYNVMAK